MLPELVCFGVDKWRSLGNVALDLQNGFKRMLEWIWLDPSSVCLVAG